MLASMSHVLRAGWAATLALGLTAVLSPAVLTAQGRPAPDPCAVGEPQARVTACTQVLARAGVDAATKLAAYLNRGRAEDELDEADAALKDFQAALDIDASNAEVLRSRAVTLHSHGRSADALRDLARVLALRPGDVITLRVRGTVYAETGQIARAVEDFSKVLDRLPGDMVAREGRGLALAASGDDSRAIQDFTRVLQREPQARVARAARAFSLFRTRQYQRAIVDWDQLLKDDPAQPAVVYCRGAAKVLSGDATGQADMDDVRLQHPDVAAAQAAACPAVIPTR